MYWPDNRGNQNMQIYVRQEPHVIISLLKQKLTFVIYIQPPIYSWATRRKHLLCFVLLWQRQCLELLPFHFPTTPFRWTGVLSDTVWEIDLCIRVAGNLSSGLPLKSFKRLNHLKWNSELKWIISRIALKKILLKHFKYQHVFVYYRSERKIANFNQHDIFSWNIHSLHCK